MSKAQSSIAAFLRALTLSRPTPDIPDFDSGINASSAWTESFPLPAEGVLRSSQAITPNINSLSDDEPDDDESEDIQDIEQLAGRAARALYAFEGKPEFRELTDVHAGDELEVLKEEVGDGWSLVKLMIGSEGRRPEVGLLPRSYYTVNRMSYLWYRRCVLISLILHLVGPPRSLRPILFRPLTSSYPPLIKTDESHLPHPSLPEDLHHGNQSRSPSFHRTRENGYPVSDAACSVVEV